MWIDSVVIRFAHFTAVGCVDKAVGKDGLRQRELRRHEHAGPNHAVEPNDILADDMKLCGPVLAQWRGLIKYTGTRYIVG